MKKSLNILLLLTTFGLISINNTQILAQEGINYTESNQPYADQIYVERVYSTYRGPQVWVVQGEYKGYVKLIGRGNNYSYLYAGVLRRGPYVEARKITITE